MLTTPTSDWQLDKDRAHHIKAGLEAASTTAALWHVIVGSDFGASVAHEFGKLIVAQLGSSHYLAFQSYDDAGSRRAVSDTASKVCIAGSTHAKEAQLDDNIDEDEM